VALRAQPLRELLERRVEHLEPAAVELTELVLAGHQVHRCSALRAGLGQEERAVRELQCREDELPRGPFLAERSPAEPPGDHEVDDQEQPGLELEDDALAHPPQPRDATPLDGADRRVRGSQDEDVPHVDALDRLAEYARREPVEVDCDVGELWQRTLPLVAHTLTEWRW
jgi:hypothetical protein